MMSPSQPLPSQALADLAPEIASTVVRVAGDIALVIGNDGVIATVAAGSLPLGGDDTTWVGQPWADVVSADTRSKAASLLQEAAQHGVSRRRELNHPAVEGGTIPVSWAAVRLGDNGPLLAVGRDLRAVAAIQQRFIEVQRDLERGYWQRREADVHYRMLFHVATDAVLVLDADRMTVIEANPAAAVLFDRPVPDLVGSPLNPLIGEALRAALDELLLTARASGHAAERRLRVAWSDATIDVSATPFRTDEQRCLLLRARHAEPSAGDDRSALSFIAQTPDSVVVTDAFGRVLWTNPAFAELCNALDKSQLKGRMIADALGDTEPDWPTLVARVRARGIVSGVTMTLRAPGVPVQRLDVCAALLADGDQEHIGFTLRTLQTPVRPSESGDCLAADVSAAAQRLGHAPLPELLSEIGRVVETHLVQKAMQASGGRIDGAADLLRVSVQQLVTRMDQLGMPLPVPSGPGGQSSPVN
jgi:transcriptional regulator PpsR